VLQQIRDLIALSPFRPFKIHLADGRALQVRHPDFVWVPKLATLFYFHEDRETNERNPLLIASVESPGDVVSQ